MLGHEDHKLVHLEQNVSHSVMRTYKKKTNDTLIPDERSLAEKLVLWREYFKNVGNLPKELQISQLKSLYKVRELEQIRGSGPVTMSVARDTRITEQIEEVLQGIVRAQLLRIRDKTRR